jgi:large subunit ribosomal protein L6
VSRIGRRPIPVPAGVEVTVSDRTVRVKGPKGELTHTIADAIRVERDEQGNLQVQRTNDERRAKELHGLSRTLVANMITGVTEGYRKTLEINGTGYRVAAKGKDLEFALGFSHPVVVSPPEGITFTVERPTLFHVDGIDKQLVGEVAANIRKLRPPEPYKGKGIKYSDEVIRRKAGKAGKK